MSAETVSASPGGRFGVRLTRRIGMPRSIGTNSFAITPPAPRMVCMRRVRYLPSRTIRN